MVTIIETFVILEESGYLIPNSYLLTLMTFQPCRTFFLTALKEMSDRMTASVSISFYKIFRPYNKSEY